MPKSTPTKSFSNIECLADRYAVGQECRLRMLHYPNVTITCELCSAVTFSDEYLLGIYRGHTQRHGSRADVIEHTLPWKCATCGAETKYAYFYCDDHEGKWNIFFGLTEDGKIIEQADDT